MNSMVLRSASYVQSNAVVARPVANRGSLPAIPCPLQRRQPVAMRSFQVTTAQQEGGGFFSSAFKDALAAALERSEGARQELGLPSSAAKLPRQPVALPPVPSASEDMLGAALEASQTSLNRLLAMRNEIDRAIEREQMQVERMMFAVDKAHKDEAYYRVLRIMQERGQSDLEN